MSSSLNQTSAPGWNQSTIPQPLRELLSKLEFLSMTQKNQKPCIYDSSFVDADSWYGSFKRFLNGESNITLLVFIDQTIDQTIDCLKDYRDTKFHKILLDALSGAREGIKILINTSYKDNPKALSKLKVCITNIDLQLGKSCDSVSTINLKMKNI